MDDPTGQQQSASNKYTQFSGGNTFLKSTIEHLTIYERGQIETEPTSSTTEQETKDRKEKKKRATESTDDGKQKTVLEQIVSAQSGQISEYFKQSKDFEALGILLMLHKLGPSVSRLPLLIDYYEVLMQTERGDEANRIVDVIFGIVKQKLKVNPKSCKRFAKRFFDGEKYFKSILFDILGNLFLAEIKDNEKRIAGIARNMRRLQESIENVCKESPSHKETVRLWVLPRVRYSLQLVFAHAAGKDKKALTVAEVACKHKLEIAENYVDDLVARETTLLEAKNMLTSVLGQEAKEITLLGTLLNNLGATCMEQKRLQEAKDYFEQAIDANMNAEYDSEEERQSHVKISNRCLGRVEEMLAYQA